MAPADVTALVAQAGDVRRRLAVEAGEHPSFGRQVLLALDVLADHAAGRIPHVPYAAVAALAAALYYYLEPLDVVPDVVPHVGLDDDALVMELACRDGADGLARYRAWREVEAPRARPAARTQTGKRRGPRRGG
jgi:uncharacterized membrane protein YkvA (DUF1232 family)